MATARTHRGSKMILASPRRIYRALLDPKAVAAWRAPDGMTCAVQQFEPREGGLFRMSLTYADTGHAGRGKSSEHADIVRGQFVELVPGERVVERVEFDSEDPAFAGAMTVTTSLAAAPEGTDVTISCENVPRGITASDHDKGITSTLANLAAYVETDRGASA